jgi:hypothetical protein
MYQNFLISNSKFGNLATVSGLNVYRWMWHTHRIHSLGFISYCTWCCVVGCVIQRFWRTIVPGKHQHLHTHWHNITSILSSTTVRTSNLAPLFAALVYLSVQNGYNDGLLGPNEQMPAYPFISHAHTHAPLLAFSALVWCMRLTKVMDAIAHALNMFNGVENSNACCSNSILFCNNWLHSPQKRIKDSFLNTRKVLQ